MDRQIIYPGQIPLETDLLNTNRNMMIALGKLIAAVLGTGNTINGLVVAPSIPAALTVSVGKGEIYSLQNVDNTAYSSIPPDTTDTIVKQGIALAATTLACAAPTTAGFSINYLIEATYLDSDTGSVVLPYYNASNPSQAYAGPGNSSASQATMRQGLVSLVAKPGIAATTGTQATPAVDAGYVALAVVTVANGQATIIAGNIVAASNGQILGSPVSQGRLLNIQTFTSSGTYTPTPGTNKIIVEVQGGGGGGGGTAATSSSQFAIAGGGASGAYGKSLLTSGFAGQTVTIGAAGTGGSVAGSGLSGGNSSFGALITAAGGTGGISGIATVNGATQIGQVTGVAAVATGGNLINATGRCETVGIGSGSGANVSGSGNASIFGGGGRGVVGTTGPGLASTSYGAGGGGACCNLSGAGQSGGNGMAGVVVITEYA